MIILARDLFADNVTYNLDIFHYEDGATSDTITFEVGSDFSDNFDLLYGRTEPSDVTSTGGLINGYISLEYTDAETEPDGVLSIQFVYTEGFFQSGEVGFINIWMTKPVLALSDTESIALSLSGSESPENIDICLASNGLSLLDNDIVVASQALTYGDITDLGLKLVVASDGTVSGYYATDYEGGTPSWQDSDTDWDNTGTANLDDYGPGGSQYSGEPIVTFNPSPSPSPSFTPSPSMTPIPTLSVTPPPTPIPSPTAAPTAQPTVRPSATPNISAPVWIYDYNGDGTSDIGIYRESSGLWAIRRVTRVYFGSTDDEAIPGDYNGDGTTDMGIYRRANGLWAIRGTTRVYYGTAIDLPIPGDYDGDETTDVGIFRISSGLWAIRGTTRAYFGSSVDIPASGYYDGDAVIDIGIFRGSSGLWAIRGISRVYFGSSLEEIVPGDYDGNGAWDYGVFRGSNGLWAIRGFSRSYFGISVDDPIPADYDGDSMDDIGIFRETSGLWAVRGITRAYYGSTGDIPVTR